MKKKIDLCRLKLRREVIYVLESLSGGRLTCCGGSSSGGDGSGDGGMAILMAVFFCGCIAVAGLAISLLVDGLTLALSYLRTLFCGN